MTGWKTKLLQHNATPWSALKFRFINGHLELTSSHKSSIKIRGYKSLIGGGKKFKNIFIHGVAFTSCLHAYLSAQWRNSRSLRAASVNTSSCFCLTKLKDERPGRVDSCVSTLSFFFLLQDQKLYRCRVLMESNKPQHSAAIYGKARFLQRQAWHSEGAKTLFFCCLRLPSQWDLESLAFSVILTFNASQQDVRSHRATT